MTTILKRSIFVTYKDGGAFQFTNAGPNEWLCHVTSPLPRQVRWQMSQHVDDDYVRHALADNNAVAIQQFD